MKTYAQLAGIKIGTGYPVRFMGVINVSPESFYKASIRVGTKNIARTAETLTREGADIIDIGAMSTAPYLDTRIPTMEEIKRIVAGIMAVQKASNLPISIDTSRSIVARAALDAGAAIINDISGLYGDEAMAVTAKKARGLILMANPVAAAKKALNHPAADTKDIFKHILVRAKQAGINKQKIVLDPGIGFFRNTALPWWKWDLSLLKNLRQFEPLGRPLLIALSRKSFLGHLLNEKDPEKRLAGSLGATVAAVLQGASLIRTHDVLQTRQAVGLVESIKRAR